ncbi:zinc finger, CCHC-type containing protein [Tanacetum coccineum]
MAEEDALLAFLKMVVNVESSKELWDSLEAKYMAGLGGNAQVEFTQHKINMDESIQLTPIELSSHLRIEESLRVQDSDKSKGNNVVGPSVVNMVEITTPPGTMTTRDGDVAGGLTQGAMFMFYLCDLHATPSLGNKKYFVIFIDDASRTDRGGEYMDTLYFQYVGIIPETIAPYTPQQNGISERKTGAVVRLPGPKLKNLGERGIECIFVGYAEHSKAFRFYSYQYHKTADRYGINSQSDYSSDGCEDIFLECKFDESGKGVIIYLYIDDMVIFGTNQFQFDMIKEFFSSKFSMKDMGEADVILGIRIKHESNEKEISQSYYIEKVLNKFNYFDCTSVSTPMDTNEKLMPNNGQVVSQLEYSKVIGCSMYAMTCTRPDIAFAVGKLSRVLKYLKKTMNYSLIYTSYPSVLEGYTDARWISNTGDNSSTSGWVFLLGRGAISWASKKQTCITSSTMKSKFVVLVATGKEAEWLNNLILEIPLWSKPDPRIFERVMY